MKITLTINDVWHIVMRLRGEHNTYCSQCEGLSNRLHAMIGGIPIISVSLSNRCLGCGQFIGANSHVCPIRGDGLDTSGRSIVRTSGRSIVRDEAVR